MNFNLIKIAIRYLLYYLKAIDEHSLHSPYIYEFYSNVIKPDFDHPLFVQIEKARQDLLTNHKEIMVNDFGAGTYTNNSKTRKISDISKHSLSPARQSRLLYRIIRYINPNHIIELGTSLGINTLYLSAANNVPVYTFEGCDHILDIAQSNFKKFPSLYTHIHPQLGNINQTLTRHLQQVKSVDFAYIDANHKYESTIFYFNQLAEKAHAQSIIIVDDIHWSAEMEKAWKEIKSDLRVSLSLDLFFMGILIFKPLYIKQDYILEF